MVRVERAVGRGREVRLPRDGALLGRGAHREGRRRRPGRGVRDVAGRSFDPKLRPVAPRNRTDERRPRRGRDARRERRRELLGRAAFVSVCVFVSVFVFDIRRRFRAFVRRKRKLGLLFLLLLRLFLLARPRRRGFVRRAGARRVGRLGALLGLGGARGRGRRVGRGGAQAQERAQGRPPPRARGREARVRGCVGGRRRSGADAGSGRRRRRKDHPK